MKRLFTLLVLCLSFGLNAQYYFNTFTAPGQNPGNLNTDAEYPVGGGLDPSWSTFHNPSASPAWSSDKSVCVWGIQGTAANDYVVKKTFGSAPNRQHWIFFTSYTYGALYTYWSIVLEETTNAIYVVDQRSSGTLTALAVGIQVNSSSAYAVNGGSNNVNSLAGLSALSDDNAYYEFLPGTRPAQDMAAQTETVPDYVILSQAPFSIVTAFTSFGANNVTSYTMNYSVNGGPAVSGNIGSVNIVTQGSTTGTHPTGWSPSSTGVYSFQVWADNINGNPDGYNSNDTIDFIVTVVDTLTPRIVCMEVFTSSTCGPCVAGNANMDDNIVPFISNYTIIKYQQDFPGAGDPYSNTESVNRRLYYGINSIPRMEIDGQWDGNAAALTIPLYNQYQNLPSFMEINIASAYYSGTTVSVNAQIKPLINYTGNNYSYQIVVIENQTTQNTGTNGETSFNNVMMNMYPTETGTSVSSLQAGSPISINVNIPMAGTNVEQMSDLKVVIFVQDNVTKEILQSAWMDVLPNGIADLDANGNGINAVYPNPTSDQFTMEYTVTGNQNVTWTMTNMMGQVVRQGENESATQGMNRVSIETTDLAEGVYFMNLTTNEGVFTQRVVITR